MTPGVYIDIPSEEYHRDKKYAALSAGGIKHLLKSPAHFREAMDNPGEPTEAMILGTLAHTFMLEPDKVDLVVAPKVDRRTKGGKEEWAGFLEKAEGKQIVTEDTWGQLHGMRDALSSLKIWKTIVAQGDPEVSVFWEHPVDDFLCKSRPDWLDRERRVIVDYKTCADASPNAFGKQVINLGYHISAAWYLEGMKVLDYGKFDYVFVAQEKTPPYSVATYRIPSEAVDLGWKLCRRACDIYAECLDTGEWGAYPDKIQDLEIPTWAYNQ